MENAIEFLEKIKHLQGGLRPLQLCIDGLPLQVHPPEPPGDSSGMAPHPENFFKPFQI